MAENQPEKQPAQATQPSGTEAAKTIDQLLAEGRELIAQLHALGVELPEDETDMYEIDDE
jgi:hypothetical protein